MDCHRSGKLFTEEPPNKSRSEQAHTHRTNLGRLEGWLELTAEYRVAGASRLGQILIDISLIGSSTTILQTEYCYAEWTGREIVTNESNDLCWCWTDWTVPPPIIYRGPWYPPEIVNLPLAEKLFSAYLGRNLETLFFSDPNVTSPILMIPTRPSRQTCSSCTHLWDAPLRSVMLAFPHWQFWD
jgi:hypothetical protein